MVKNIKILVIFLSCLLFRLIPLRAPNLEPIMASLMPISRKYSLFATFFFAFSSMVLYDLLTGYVGFWTWTTSLSYGFIAIASFFFFQKFKAKIFNYVFFAFLATIFFDLVTGILFAPVFGVSIQTAFMLQVPFTLIHLAGNIGFALTITPVLNSWLSSERIFSLKKSYSSTLGGAKI